MIIYLAKILLASGLLYFVYALLLSKTKSFVFNRFYLLLMIPASLIIPFITVNIPSINIPFFTADEKMPIAENAVFIPHAAESQISQYEIWFSYFMYAYLIICFILLLVNIIKYKKFIDFLKRAQPSSHQNVFLINDLHTPFSFLNKMYLPQEPYLKNNIEDSIIAHEQVHISQKHSLDILWMEALSIILWFHPIVYLIKKAVKNNHEYLADEAVVRKHEQKHYQQLIIQWSSSTHNKTVLLASNFNFLTTKKRLIMLQKKSSKYKQWMYPLVSLVFAGVFTAALADNAQAQKVETVKATSHQKKKVESVHFQARGSKQFAIIKYKDGSKQEEEITSVAQKQAVEKKYSMPIPPPPPPVSAKKVKKSPPSPPPPPVERKRFTPPKVLKDKSNVPPPPPPPTQEVVRFSPPKIVKNKKTKSNEKVRSFSPPIIIKDSI